MKANTIINRYILLELFSPFAISLFFLTFVFLMTRIPEIMNMVVNYNADIISVFLLMIFMLPRFLEFTIPMSVMIATLLTFMRMSGENEIIALKGAGVSLYRLIVPVIVFSVMGLIFSLAITGFGVAWGKTSLKKKSLELAKSSMDLALQERRFNSEIDDIMIYISHVDMKTKNLEDVFIEDKRTKGMVSISVASSGKLIKNPDESIYTIRLFDGIINQVDQEEKSVNSIKFGSYDINIDLNQMSSSGQKAVKKLSEKNIVELARFIQSSQKDVNILRDALLEFHEKFSIPFACLVLGLLAFPLGVQSNAQRRSSGFSLGVFFFILYYLMLAVGMSAGEINGFPPMLAMWFPNMIIGMIGLFFLIRNAKERPVSWPKAVTRSVIWLKSKIRRS